MNTNVAVRRIVLALLTVQLLLATPLSGLTAWFAAGGLTVRRRLRLAAALLWAAAPALQVALNQGRAGALIAHIMLPLVVLALLAAVYLLTWVRHRRPPRSRWFYRAAVAAGPLAAVALICGWITTEVGRQPWIVYEYMRVEEAVTGASGIPYGYAFVAALLVLGLTAYAVLAGADFGAGVWDVVGGHEGRLRALVESSMGPVWEANHVWLIFALVTFWTAFPVAFGSFASTLYIPLFLAAVGINRLRAVRTGGD